MTRFCDICDFNGVDPGRLKVVRATENYLSIAEMVDAGIGWAILPSYIEVSAEKNLIFQISANAVSAKQFYIAYRRDLSKLEWFRDLLGEIHGCFQ